MARTYTDVTESGEALSFGTASIQSSVKRGGDYALRNNPTTTGTGGIEMTSFNGTTGIILGGLNNATAYARCYFRYATKPASGSEQIIQFARLGGGLLKLMVIINSTGTLSVLNQAGTLVATGATVLAANTWYRLEAMSVAGTSAAYELRINGVTELSGTCDQLVDTIGRVYFGKVNNRSSQTVDFYFDDMTIDTGGWPGSGCVRRLDPISTASTYSAWSGTYADVDETPHDGDTTYISTSSSGVQHSVRLESCTDAGIPAGVTFSAVAHMAVVRDEGGTSSLKEFVRYASSNGGHTNAQNIGSTYEYRGGLFNSSLTRANIDAMEVGVDSSAAVAVRCTRMLGLVEFGNPVITLASSVVTVATASGGTPAHTVSPFDGIAVGEGTGGNMVATVVLSDSAKATFQTLPSGWTESPTGTFSCTSRTNAQLVTDLQALTLTGLVAGSTTATLTALLADGTDYSSAVVTVSVVAPDLSVSVASGGTFELGEIEINTPDSQQFTLVNNGTASLVIGTVAISGTGFTLEAGDNSSGDTVAAGASTTVTVNFAFTSNGDVTGTLTIPSNDAGSPYVIYLHAKAVGGAEGGGTISAYSNMSISMDMSH